MPLTVRCHSAPYCVTSQWPLLCDVTVPLTDITVPLTVWRHSVPDWHHSAPYCVTSQCPLLTSQCPLLCDVTVPVTVWHHSAPLLCDVTVPLTVWRHSSPYCMTSQCPLPHRIENPAIPVDPQQFIWWRHSMKVWSLAIHKMCVRFPQSTERENITSSVCYIKTYSYSRMM